MVEPKPSRPERSSQPWRPAPLRALRTAGRIVRETLLTVAALGGAACIVLVVLAFTGGYSLIMFKTGSMSPTIPAGSVALVREIRASEVGVGDVLTVNREGQLPVTHRVTSVGEGSSNDERVITMRGDANEVEDPLPYTITEGRVVIGSLPHLAHVIVWFGSPWVLGGITIGAALLVTWAFWPRDPASREPRESRGDPRPREPKAAPGTGVEENRDPSEAQEPAGTQGPVEAQEPAEAQDPAGIRARHAAVAVALLVGALAASAPLLAPTPAQADGPKLRLHSDLLADQTYRLDPVAPFFWHLDVDASSLPANGDLRVSLAGSGDAALGIRAEVRACERAWREGACPSGERVLRGADTLPLDDAPQALLDGRTPAVAHLRIALTARPSESASGGEQARLVVRATAGEASDEVRIDGTPDLPATGAEPFGAGLVLAPAAVAVGLGAALLARARRRAGTRGLAENRGLARAGAAR